MMKAIVATCLLLLASQAVAAEPAQQPNVLLIIADDLNLRLGCYGAQAAQTPNIDRLAARGVRFDRAYCNYPVCNASRTSFLSGRLPETTGVLDNNTNPRIRLGESFQFLPEYFAAHGYFTAGCGKVAHGSFNDVLRWDYYTEPAREAADGRQPRKRDGRRGRRQAAAKDPSPSGTDVPFAWQATTHTDAEEPDGQVARRLLKYFSAPQRDERPFFIVAGFHKPHIPHTAPQKYFDLHSPGQMPTPPEPAVVEQNIPPIAQAPKYYPDLSSTQRRAIIQHYYAATSFMDAQVGVLLDELDRQNLWDSTVVVFMSDHGWHLGEHGGFYAKMSVMDESARSPLIIAAPAAQAGVPTGALVDYLDLFPTLVDLCSLPEPAGLQGKSFAAALKDPSLPGKEAVYTIVRRGTNNLGQALYIDGWRYIEWSDGSRQLYDAASDPHEYRNLAGQPEYAETLTLMHQALTAYRSEMGLASTESAVRSR